MAKFIPITLIQTNPRSVLVNLDQVITFVSKHPNGKGVIMVTTEMYEGSSECLEIYESMGKIAELIAGNND